MRKITSEAKKAFEAGRDYNGGNTRVIRGGLFLFGNKIAEYASLFPGDGNRDINITNAGWFTSTTKERLNALEGVHIVQNAGEWYLNGTKWDGSWITVKPDGKLIK